MRLLNINVHPVKSTAIRPVRESAVLPRGLADDRSWMVVDADGSLVSAREVHGLFSITADTPLTDPTVSSDLRLRAPGVDELAVSRPEGDPIPVRLHRNDLFGVPAGQEADAWLSSALGRDDVRLIWCDDPARRTLNPAFSRTGDHTAFADGYPITIASRSSLERLNEWIVETAVERGEEAPEPLPMQRFRPNLVVDGEEPFAEDAWQNVTIGQVRLRVAKPTGRCVMTTVDLDTLETGKEPIRTLARHRRPAGAPETLFAVHLIPQTCGTVSVGDEVIAEA